MTPMEAMEKGIELANTAREKNLDIDAVRIAEFLFYGERYNPGRSLTKGEIELQREKEK